MNPRLSFGTYLALHAFFQKRSRKCAPGLCTCVQLHQALGVKEQRLGGNQRIILVDLQAVCPICFSCKTIFSARASWTASRGGMPPADVRLQAEPCGLLWTCSNHNDRFEPLHGKITKVLSCGVLLTAPRFRCDRTAGQLHLMPELQRPSHAMCRPASKAEASQLRE
jgi:hypothetical protein